MIVDKSGFWICGWSILGWNDHPSSSASLPDTELNQAAENAETEKRMSGFKGPNDKKGVEKSINILKMALRTSGVGT